MNVWFGVDGATSANPTNPCSLCGISRGVYLATVFYHKENILVTSEDQLPLVEIQCCSTSIIQDFLWFAKVSPAVIPLHFLWFAKVSPASIPLLTLA